MTKVEEITRVGGSNPEYDRVEQVLSPETTQQLRSWKSTIEDRAQSELPSSSTPQQDAMDLGRFSCLVDDAANAIERLHQAYTHGGQFPS